jgi:predicted permease
MYPKTDTNLKLKVQTEFQMRAERSPPDTALVIMLSLLALCVLLVACANVTGLLLSRSAVRAREIALRMAVGASRSSLMRQLLLENLLLALAGSGAGLFLALGAVQFFNSMPLPTDIPINYSFSLDQRALVFTLAIAVISTFLFGLTPALGSTRVDLSKALKEREGTGSKGTRLWGRNLIVGGQVALSLVLLIVAAFLVEGFRWQLNQGPGFRVEGLQLMSFDTGVVHYTDSQRDLFYQNLLQAARQTAGVESAALTSSVPMSMGVDTIGVIPDGRTLKRGEDAPTVFDGVVSPDYFLTLSITLLEGRPFLQSDNMHTPAVAIVNQEFARHYWPKQSAIGKHVRLRDAAGKQVEVIGVAKTSKYIWITEMPMDFIYLPFAQNPQGNMALVAQSKAADAGILASALRQVVQRLDRNMPVFEVRTMKNLFEMRAVATPNLLSRLVAALGVMGLILAVIGLYGVVSYSVSRRSREFGIRMAIGADRQKVMRMVLRQSMVLGIGGIVVGLIAGVLACRVLTSQMLFAVPLGVRPFVVVSLLLIATILFAGFLPARRASLIDPMRALRDE